MKAVILIFSVVAISACSQNAAYEANVGLLPVGGFMLFYDSQGPLSYTSLTPDQIPQNVILLEEVIGESCQHGLSIPLFIFSPLRGNVSGARGDGSYRRALDDLHGKYLDLDGIFDIKVDIHQYSILGIYKRNCTEVVARGFQRHRTGE
jgi:hypothetical protein